MLAFAAPAGAQPGDLKLSIGAGRVTIIADNVPVRTILQEWARLGQSKIVNGEKVLGAPVTLRLINVPEDEALDVVLRSASGYLAAPRDVQMANASRFDRIVILATSRPTSSAPAPAPAAMPMPQHPSFQPPNVPPQPPVEDDQEPDDQLNPLGAQPQVPFTAPRPGPIQLTPPNGPTGAQPNPNQPPQPLTAPRPGVIQPPPQGQPQQPPRPIPQ